MEADGESQRHHQAAGAVPKNIMPFCWASSRANHWLATELTSGHAVDPSAGMAAGLAEELRAGPTVG